MVRGFAGQGSVTEEARPAREIRRWFEETERTDEREDRKHGRTRRGDELAEPVANKQQRLQRIREAKAALEAEAKAASEAKADREREGKPRRCRQPGTPAGVPPDKAQRNSNDPESRIMKTGDGFIQG